MTSQKLLAQYRSKLLEELFKKMKWLNDNYDVDTIILDELIELKCGENWSKSISGVAEAFEYICKICIKSGDVGLHEDF